MALHKSDRLGDLLNRTASALLAEINKEAEATTVPSACDDQTNLSTAEVGVLFTFTFALRSFSESRKGSTILLYQRFSYALIYNTIHIVECLSLSLALSTCHECAANVGSRCHNRTSDGNPSRGHSSLRLPRSRLLLLDGETFHLLRVALTDLCITY